MTSGDPNYQAAPTLGLTVILPDSSTGTIVNIIRYDSFGKWCCGISQVIGITLVLSIYLKDTVWYAEEYVPTRFPDEDGVLKCM